MNSVVALNSFLGTAIITSTVFALLWGAMRGTLKPFAAAALLVVILMGVGVLMLDRITDIKLPGGSLKAVTAQAVADAQTINALKEKAQDQASAIGDAAAKALQAESDAQNAIQQVAAAEQAVLNLNAHIATAEVAITSITQQVKLSELISDAQNDSRAAFEELRNIAKDVSNVNHDRALRSADIISQHLQNDLFLEYSFTDQNALRALDQMNIDNIPTTVVQSNPYGTLSLLNYVVQNSRFSVLEKLDYALKLTDNESLLVVSAVGRAFNRFTKQNFGVLDVNKIKEWWAAHRKEFTSGQSQ